MAGSRVHEAAEAPAGALVELLGQPRATIVRLLKGGEWSAPELARELGVSDVAVRRHLAILEEDGLVAERVVRQARGRPVARYRLTSKAVGLFPSRYAQVAGELLDFISAEQGREGVRGYLRWHRERETEAYRSRVTAETLPERLEQLAEALRAAGFEAEVVADGDAFRLTQTHCAVLDVAREHPELCAYEAAMFRDLLDAKVSRRDTLANDRPACVCAVTPRPDGGQRADATDVRDDLHDDARDRR